MKKQIWILCFIAIIATMTISTVNAFAQSYVSNDSGAGVGFFGEWVTETEPTEPPTEPETTKPERPPPPTRPPRRPQMNIPQTGDLTNIGGIVIRLVVFGLIIFLLVLTKGKDKKEEKAKEQTYYSEEE